MSYFSELYSLPSAMAIPSLGFVVNWNRPVNWESSLSSMTKTHLSLIFLFSAPNP